MGVLDILREEGVAQMPLPLLGRERAQLGEKVCRCANCRTRVLVDEHNLVKAIAWFGVLVILCPYCTSVEATLQIMPPIPYEGAHS